MDSLVRVLPFQEVRDKLEIEKKNFVKNFYSIASLVTEIYNNKLYEYWGYGTFKDFVSESLDVQISAAYKMVAMINNKNLLEIKDEQLLEIKPTKVLEILSLKDPDEVKTLLLEAKTASTDVIKEKVRKAKGLEENYWRKFLLNKDSVEIIDAAIVKAQRDYGNSVDIETGDVKEISPSRALELICADYLSNIC